MSTLLEISDDLRRIADLLEESEGDGELLPDDTIAGWLAEAEGNLEVKLDNYVGLKKSLEKRAAVRQAEADQAKAEYQRLQILVKIDENKAARLEKQLLYFLDRNQMKFANTKRYRLSACNNGGKAPVEILCRTEELPPAFVRHSPAPDVDAIRATLEAGGEVPGCKLLPRGRHLRIQ